MLSSSHGGPEEADGKEMKVCKAKWGTTNCLNRNGIKVDKCFLNSFCN